MSSKKIQMTKNYRLFRRQAEENRPLNVKKHKKLKESMQQYGFLSCFPIVCVRDENGNLVIKDGQHRYTLAELLGLPIYWVEETTDFDVAIVNSAAKPWVLRDYVDKHIANNLPAYRDGLEFVERHGLPIGVAFALLAGTTAFANCQESFVDGTFKVKDRKWADAVAGIYGPMGAMAPCLKTSPFVLACMAVCRVPDFDSKRLLDGASKCRDKLVSFSTRDAFLDMMEGLYNYGRKNLVGLKSAAVMVMRNRNGSVPKRPKKAEPELETAAVA